ncbi:branched-chain amino acid ABC transporter permease [Caldovatus sediminis]|uniref:Branched-chain amino acid ABC transporter permease n=1 Tax=Caldovatus sediminis TaxID=2041189 RepID=A0A8J3ECW4_9PROT|nr:branched-chain amino acid ABC transporter permease [Caldovatus sediminis]GGG39037.1 branched-chain amino acid ABC transporter permease [Caldovatus sediminis]
MSPDTSLTTATPGAALGRPAASRPDELGLWGFTRAQLGALAVLIVFLVVAPFWLYPVFLMKLLCFALFASAFNLLIGYVGLLSFGHAAYFGMGGYLAGHAAKVWGLPPELSILTGAAVAGGLGAVFGWLAIRRSGIYFAMITLALAQMVYFFCVQAPFTGGEDGIQQIPRGTLLGFIGLQDDMAMYWFVAAIFLAGFLLIHRIVHSPFGQVIKAIRENEPRTTSLGYRTDDYKLVTFILSATLAGVAGGTKSLVFGIATLTDVHWAMSGEVVLMTLVGGLGTVFGPLVGAAVIVTMQNYLAEMGAWVTVIQGAIFVACVLAFRRGIVGEIGNLLRVKL